MPIHDIVCRQCGFAGEVITLGQAGDIRCPACGSTATQRQMSPTSSLTGKATPDLPGVGDTGCCGHAPGTGGCAGPGSCCGKGPI